MAEVEARRWKVRRKRTRMWVLIRPDGFETMYSSSWRNVMDEAVVRARRYEHLAW